jgi:hypothetical protein
MITLYGVNPTIVSPGAISPGGPLSLAPGRFVIHSFRTIPTSGQRYHVPLTDSLGVDGGRRQLCMPQPSLHEVKRDARLYRRHAESMP